MASFVPDLHGKTFVYANSSGDTLIMNGGEHFILQDEELDDCSKCSCDLAFIGQAFYCHGNGIEDNAKSSISIMEGYYINFYSDLQGGIDVYTCLHATFDDQEHFVMRDFGDTLILTKEPSQCYPSPDTIILVRNIGVIRVNDYTLIDIRD